MKQLTLDDYSLHAFHSSLFPSIQFIYRCQDSVMRELFSHVQFVPL